MLTLAPIGDSQTLPLRNSIQDNELFYLMSRGLSRRDATELIIMSYFQDLVDLAPDHVKEDLTREIHQHIHTAQV